MNLRTLVRCLHAWKSPPEGHPFYGNQWTGGSGAGPNAADSDAAGTEKPATPTYPDDELKAQVLGATTWAEPKWHTIIRRDREANDAVLLQDGYGQTPRFSYTAQIARLAEPLDPQLPYRSTVRFEYRPYARGGGLHYKTISAGYFATPAEAYHGMRVLLRDFDKQVQQWWKE